MNSAFWWLTFNIISIIILSFYSMMEMACVSFNKARLQYYVSKGNRRAKWLNFLLHNPSRLFGTTLIGVNVAMIVGSECAREFHSAIGLNPDLAPLSQVLIVVIFGELAPMFAARRYPEHVAMLGVPIVYISAKLMAPLIWSIGAISHIANKLVGGKQVGAEIFISRDELQKVLEEQDEDQLSTQTKKEDFNVVVGNIFGLREKNAGHIMEPLLAVQMLPSNCVVAQARKLWQHNAQTYLPIYHNTQANIVGIVIPRDLIRAPDNHRIRDYAKSPWFITKQTRLLQILKQFRNNKQQAAVVLDEKGQAVGILTLDDLLEEVFGKIKATVDGAEKRQFLIEKTFPGEMKIEDFNKQFGVHLDSQGAETLAELIIRTLGHHPAEGESIFVSPFELKVKEASLLEVRSVTIKTRL